MALCHVPFCKNINDEKDIIGNVCGSRAFGL